MNMTVSISTNKPTSPVELYCTFSNLIWFFVFLAWKRRSRQPKSATHSNVPYHMCAVGSKSDLYHKCMCLARGTAIRSCTARLTLSCFVLFHFAPTATSWPPTWPSAYLHMPISAKVLHKCEHRFLTCIEQRIYLTWVVASFHSLFYLDFRYLFFVFVFSVFAWKRWDCAK